MKITEWELKPIDDAHALVTFEGRSGVVYWDFQPPRFVWRIAAVATLLTIIGLAAFGLTVIVALAIIHFEGHR